MSRSEEHHHCGSCCAFPHSIFADLPPHLLDELVALKRHGSFTQGEVLLAAGQPFTGIICLQSGSVSLSEGKCDTEEALYIGSAGEAFGLRDLNVSETNTREITGREPGHYCFIPKEVLTRLSMLEPTLMGAIIRQLCHRVSHIERSAYGI